MILFDQSDVKQHSIAVESVKLARNSFLTPNIAMDRLFEIFPDKYPKLVSESSEEWTFELGWPRHILEPIDPLLVERTHTCLRAELCDLDEFRLIEWHNEIPVVFSMFHSWAILAPALALKYIRRLPRTIVHVDAHHDLAPSLLGVIPSGSLVNPAFAIECNLDRASSIENAIRGGLINKANFLTTYIIGMDSGNLFHVDSACASGKFGLALSTSPISVGNIHTSEHRLGFNPFSDLIAWKLHELPELPSTLNLLPDEPLWLDIDLDAFCNRFDGDSDNCNLLSSREELESTLSNADRLLNALSNSDWLANISAISVAASPGFFPSEYWEALIPKILDGIRRLVLR